MSAPQLIALGICAAGAIVIVSGFIRSVYTLRLSALEEARAIGWNEGREYEIALAKKRRDKRGRFKKCADELANTITT